ncbi:hypothetical protein CaCOL14_009949 [Colletotrichum acutatum]
MDLESGTSSCAISAILLMGNASSCARSSGVCPECLKFLDRSQREAIRSSRKGKRACHLVCLSCRYGPSFCRKQLQARREAQDASLGVLVSVELRARHKVLVVHHETVLSLRQSLRYLGSSFKAPYGPIIVIASHLQYSSIQDLSK